MLPPNWPKWTVILIGLALAVFVILIALALEPMAQALASRPTPTPVIPRLAYAAPQSRDCILCHTNEETLRQTVTDAEELKRLWIDPADVLSTHGQLGCMTCHRGQEGTELQVAHTGLVKDPTLHFKEECILCHRNLPDEIPGEQLRAPHNSVVRGLAQGLTCSDCHGEVGHGFVSGEVTCSMNVCMDCHKARNLDNRCNVCHIGPHDVSAVLSCSDCHSSTERWNEIHLAVHPVELVGWHAQIDCFDCHDWPNFGGLRYVCSDCHQRPHDFGDENCERCHTPEGWTK
ncbi:MAG: hypothetical protein ACUVXE_05710 [Anaerolineae bacterium]